MASAPGGKPSPMKVREHRERLREQGLRPVWIRVPTSSRKPPMRTAQTEPPAAASSYIDRQRAQSATKPDTARASRMPSSSPVIICPMVRPRVASGALEAA